MGVPTINTSTWFGAGTASAAVLTPAQVAAVAPLVNVTAMYIVMYYSSCFFQSWSKLYLSAYRRPSLFFPRTSTASTGRAFVRAYDFGASSPRTIDCGAHGLRLSPWPS